QKAGKLDALALKAQVRHAVQAHVESRLEHVEEPVPHRATLVSPGAGRVTLPTERAMKSFEVDVDIVVLTSDDVDRLELLTPRRVGISRRRPSPSLVLERPCGFANRLEQMPLRPRADVGNRWATRLDIRGW